MSGILLCPSEREVNVQTRASASDKMSAIESIPDNLIREPVEYLFADHVRQRTLCELLRTLSERGEAGDDSAFADLLEYLEVDHPNHMADEEEDLFPRLRRRLNTNSEFARLLDELEAEHRRNVSRARELASDLRCLPENGGRRISEELRASIQTFVSDLMKHLTLEDERVIPVARSILTDADSEHIGRAMACRRGIEYPG
jgi:hemerythrin-like domain-containing protein